MPALALLRAGLVGAGIPDVVAGPAFAAALVGVAASMPVRREAAAGRPAPLPLALLAGGAVGAALLLPGRWLGHPAPAYALVRGGWFAAWAPATATVVVAEEWLLRGRLQPLLRGTFGPAPAIWLSAAAFALAHVPLYGAGALPLDLGVGLLAGVLREWSGRVAPSMLAHAVADFGWWFLG